MNRWWLEQRRKLWWKEVRETWSFLALGWIVIFALLWKFPFQEGAAAYIWGIGYHSGAVAILLFVAICLGVTAYAVEEEYETLYPLLAKPISLNDIFATKYGVRLGLLFVSMIILGLLELWTGAWPIKWNIPSPVIFERWVGGLSLLVMGLGLGIYFGKTLGRQTPALLASAMIFVVGYVLLVLSPLSLIFETDDTFRYLWIRDVVFPIATGVIATMAAIRATPGEPGFLTRQKSMTGTVMLGLYAFLLWSFLIVPPQLGWRDTSRYQDHAAVRLGGPRAGLNALVNRFIKLEAGPEEDEPDEIAIRMIKEVTLSWPSSYISSYSIYWGYDLLGQRQRGYTLATMPDNEGPRILSDTDVERMAVEHRNPRWITACLELVRDGSLPLLNRMAAIHLAGVAGDAANTEAIAGFLHDPSEHIRIMSALMLIGREDPRGMDVLRNHVMDGSHNDLRDHFALRAQRWRLDLGPDLDDLMREWVLSAEMRGSRSVGQMWLKEYGSVADMDLVRQSEWLDLSASRRKRESPEAVDILSYLEAWDTDYYRRELHQALADSLEKIEALYPQVMTIPASVRNDYRRWRHLGESDQRNINRFNSLTNRTADYLLEKLILEDDVEAAETWLRIRRMKAEIGVQYWRYRGDPIIGHLPRLGEPGYQALREVVADRDESPSIRFQASLVLAFHGHSEYHNEAFRILDIYRGHSEFFEQYSILGAFQVLLEQGNLRYAGPIIEANWEEIQHHGEPFRRRYVRTWDHRMVETMERATGQSFGWNLKAWHKWWEREGMHIAATGND